MERLEAHKRICDELFKQGDVERSLREYESLADEVTHMLSSRCETRVDLEALLKNVLNNAAAVCLKLERFSECASYCDQVLLMEHQASATNLKALYRRAQAFKALGCKNEDESLFKLALSDVDAILSSEDQNPQAKNLKLEIRKASADLQTAKRYKYAKENISSISVDSAHARLSTNLPAADVDNISSREADGGVWSFMVGGWQPTDDTNASINFDPAATEPQIQLGQASAVVKARVGGTTFKQLLQNARGSVPSSLRESEGCAGRESKEIEPVAAVRDALAELQQAEAAEAAAIVRRAAQTAVSDGGFGVEPKNRGKYAIRNGITTGKKIEPQALSAWEQLQLDEAEAARRFKELVCTSSKQA